MVSDEELMRQTAEGNPAAFNLLLLRHQRTAWRFASRFLDNGSEVQDAVQDAFLKIFQAAPRYRPTASFSTYLYQVMLRLCMDRLRKKRAFAEEHVERYACPNPTPEQNSIENERNDAVHRAIRRLSARQRAVIVLREYADLSYRQIADILHTTPKSVERLLSHARSALQGELKKYLEE